MKNIAVAAFLLTCLSLSAESTTAETKDIKIPEDQKITFYLPIDWSGEEKINLRVSIPENFKSLQATSTWADEETNIIEFIPKNETGENWSEIITIQKIIGKGVQAGVVLKFIKEAMLSESKNSKVIDEQVFEEEEYVEALLMLAYDYNNRREILGSHYFSGPHDCVGVQYTVHQKDKDADKTVAKIDKFFKDQIEVVTEK